LNATGILKAANHFARQVTGADFMPVCKLKFHPRPARLAGALLF
jgi:hypothetical protein